MTDTVDDAGSWLLRFRAAPETAGRLVCFPHAGGAATYYHPLSAALHPTVQVLVAQYPGRQNRLLEEPLVDLAALADQAFASMRPVLADRPVLFGHSMGAIVAFEVAVRMERELGVSPARLVVSGHRPPGLCRGRPAGRSDEELLADMARLGGTDESVLADWEMLELLLPALRADYRAIDGYTGPGGPPLRCPVTVFVGDSDPHVTVDQVVAWRAHTVDGEVDLHRFAGGHFYLAERPDEFADRLLRVVRTGADRP